MHLNDQTCYWRDRIAQLRWQYANACPDDPQRELIAEALLNAYHEYLVVMRQRIADFQQSIAMVEKS